MMIYFLSKEGESMNERTIAGIVKASGVSAGELVLVHFWGEASQGSVFFEDLYWEGTHCRDVTLTVADGEISGSSCPEVARRFAAMPRAERTVCELGLGMNPHVTELCGYPLPDEKMAGTFHIAVGANTMFGGRNEAADHVDFVGRGEVEVIA